MEQQFETRPEMASEMQFLITNYPRDAWADHPNFAQSTMNWMNAHNGFRQLNNICTDSCERWIDRDYSDEKFVAYLARYGGMLVGNLHGHHNWEDHAFFPEIMGTDPRAEQGLELLESDHQELDQRLDNITNLSNRSIKLLSLDPKQMHNEIGKLYNELRELSALLDRHLTDEEELIVPVILHYKMRG